MKTINDHISRCLLAVQHVALAALLVVGLMVSSLFAPRAMSEEEVETPHWVHVIRNHCCETRSPQVRLPSPLVVRPQGRAIESAMQARHTNSEQSNRNGIGAYLII